MDFDTTMDHERERPVRSSVHGLVYSFLQHLLLNSRPAPRLLAKDTLALATTMKPLV